MKKVLVISSSLRFRSNSEALADSFARGAAEAGHSVEKISLQGRDIRFCKGCLACQRTRKCVIDDDMQFLMAKVHDADVLCFATPVYYYEMSGQLKTFLDRCNPLYVSDYHFRKVYLACSATDTDDATPSRAVSGLQGWISCFPEARFGGYVFGGGVTSVGEIGGHAALDDAYAMGQAV